jgi:MoaA/NifB/PqqE/SkfB family radical SAM enzyme
MDIPGLNPGRLAVGLSRLLTGDPVPLFCSLEVTLRCNGRCAYCGSRDAVSADPGELSTDEWKSVIDDLALSGCLSISLTGGEPLLRTDIEALAAHAVARRLSVRLNTNGRLLEKKRSILRYISNVSVSLDGVERVNDGLRGDGAFAAAMAAINTARFAGVGVCATTVLSRESIEGLDGFLDFLRANGLKSKFQPQFGDRLRSHDFKGVPPPEAQAMRRAIERLKAARKDGVVRNSAEGLELLARAFEGAPVPMACVGGRLFVRVTARGGVEVCGLANDPCVAAAAGRNRSIPPFLDVRDGIVYSMKRIGWPFECRGCLSASRVELNRIV